MITHLPLISILLPANALAFFGFINNIASLNLIPVDSVNTFFFSFDDYEDQPYNSYYLFMNYTSVNNILNMGLLFYIYISNIFAIILAVSLKLMGLTARS